MYSMTGNRPLMCWKCQVVPKKDVEVRKPYVGNVQQLAPPFKIVLPQSQSAFTAPGPTLRGPAMLEVEARTRHS